MLRPILHFAVRRFQRLRRLLWFVTRPQTSGAHAAALTPEGKIVLVKLSYADGWRLPGGGRKQDEPSEEAVLRELREEIGLRSYEAIETVADFRHRPDHKDDRSRLFIVRGVSYRPRWSLEIEEVGEFDLHALPAETARITLRLLNATGLIGTSTASP